MNSPDFTGERFIPGQGGAQIAYEHLHRYQFALRWAAGKKVLDVAAGIGYGAAILAGTAQSVWAIDLDAASVRYARQAYPNGNLLFVRGDATFLPVKSRTVDLVVALEVLEHVEKQEELVAELARVVRTGGTMLISTPNKAIYSDARNYRNPFHLREFYRDEFLTLLGRHFKSIQLVHQQVRAGSLILSEDSRPAAAEIVAKPIGELPESEPMYFIALCRASKPPRNIPPASAYLDTGDGLLGEWEQRLKTAGAELDRINRELEKLGSWCHEIETSLEARDATIYGLQAGMEREICARDRRLSGLQGEVEKLSQWGLELRDGIATRDRLISGLQAEMKRELALRDEMLEGIQNELNERARWAADLERELGERDQALELKQNEIAERNRWAADLAAEVASRDETIRRTQEELVKLAAQFTERGKWAQDLEREIAARDVRLRHAIEELGRISSQFEQLRRRRIYRILSRIGVFPA